MKPQPSHTTPPYSDRPSQSSRSIAIRSIAMPISICLILICFIASLAQTFEIWRNRNANGTTFGIRPSWSIESASSIEGKCFLRVQDASFWNLTSHQIITSKTSIATQSGPARLKSLLSSSQIVIAPLSIATVDGDFVSITSGFISVTGPARVQIPNGVKIIAPLETVLIGTDGLVPALTPSFGSILELQSQGQPAGKLHFSWDPIIESAEMIIEFARDSSFKNITFSQSVSSTTSVNVDFSDRSPGAWFARVIRQNQILGVTAFNFVASQTPGHVHPLGRRWISWQDSGMATMYRVEFSISEDFKNIKEGFLVRNHEFDLTRVSPGAQFVRVTSLSINGLEYAGRPFAINVREKTEILSAGLELNDPDLKLLARGWKIVLSHDELTRIREGFVILRESELRGIRVSNELRDSKNFKSIIFELARDESFKNPERVKVESHGELLPPALPLGILYARLRRIEEDGRLGAFGPASRLTTWLPGPIPNKPRITSTTTGINVELQWDIGTVVGGFELKLSSDPSFPNDSTTTVHTREPRHTVVAVETKKLFWTVTAINENGSPVSISSPPQDVRNLHKLFEISAQSKRISTAPRERQPAAAMPQSPLLIAPIEDAIIVGGTRARKYGKLTWKMANQSKFEVQISKDNDFVQIIEKAKTSQPEFTLQGDLPEGSLFWRVRKPNGEWSTSRKFELVYE